MNKNATARHPIRNVFNTGVQLKWNGNSEPSRQSQRRVGCFLRQCPNIDNKWKELLDVADKIGCIEPTENLLNIQVDRSVYSQRN